jgi:hypothetical protein
MANTGQPSLPSVEELKKQKRKRATHRDHATRFMNAINTFDDSNDIEELEHYKDHLQGVLQNLIVLDEFKIYWRMKNTLPTQKYAKNWWMARSGR